MSTTILIKQAIMDCLDKGMKDKSEIFSKIVEQFGIPRPTVRRVSRELREEMIQKVKILDYEVPLT